jgi:hypothetical protein
MITLIPILILSLFLSLSLIGARGKRVPSSGLKEIGGSNPNPNSNPESNPKSFLLEEGGSGVIARYSLRVTDVISVLGPVLGES